MPTYKVGFTIDKNYHVDVEADTPQDAADLVRTSLRMDTVATPPPTIQMDQRVNVSTIEEL
jgi:hypothetical protein